MPRGEHVHGHHRRAGVDLSLAPHRDRLRAPVVELDPVGRRRRGLARILAVADGVVDYAGGRSGYGKMVEIRHGNGYVTRYAHNRRLLVKKGDLVRQGQVIATMGRSGR